MSTRLLQNKHINAFLLASLDTECVVLCGIYLGMPFAASQMYSSFACLQPLEQPASKSLVASSEGWLVFNNHSKINLAIDKVDIHILHKCDTKRAAFVNSASG